ncbi:hypothetical protein [Streptomyces coeruleorubidus]|uniref:hypothetical protein n=1 Tax=Streptomyces coeruleorubidus TaxID=116188 RepID=UPI0031592628
MTTPGFRPTHVVPQHGMPAWEAPDPARPTVDLDPLLPVQLVERQGDWGHVLCFNGWSAWVDGRRLVAVPQDPPAADGPLTRSADPRPLLARAQEALARYRSAVEDVAGGLDRESFHARTHGLRIGVVVDGESVWLYDAAHGHWVYADGTRANTYATDDTPRAHPEPRPAEPPAPARTPTRVVPAGAVEETPRAEQVPRTEQPAPPAEAPPTRVVPPEPPEAVSPEPPEPTRVVSPEAAEPRWVVSPGGAEPRRVVSSEAPERTRVASPETPETRVVSPEVAESTRSVPSEAPEPSRTVPPEAPASTRVVSPEVAESTRSVPSEAPEPPRTVPPEAAQPTQVVSSEAPEPSRTVPPEAAEPTRVVSPAAPRAAEPTRVVSPEAPPTRVGSPEGDGEPASDEEAVRAGRGAADAGRGARAHPDRVARG